MAFCNKCGAQLDGDERFCAKCGNVTVANGSVASVPAAGPILVPVGVPPMAAAPHMPIVAPGQVPMSVAIPQGAPAKKSGMVWLGVILAAAAGYYYYTHHMQPQGPQPGSAPQGQPGPQNPGPQSQPGGNPGQQPGGYPGQQPGGYPGQQPSGNPGQQPAGYPGQQPGGYPGQQPSGNPGQQPGGGGGSSAALVRMQSFTGQWNAVNGVIQISNGRWVNASPVSIQSATLECVQYASSGATLTQTQITLNGPVPPGTADTFTMFQMGQITQGLAKVNCGIVGVTPAQ